jgi:predicted metallo-beta-lactamase superfamily hydrolase
VKQRNIWNENGTEILKIIGDLPKINKSGLKRAAESANSVKQKCREVIIADRYYFGKKGFGSFVFLRSLI